MPPSSSTNTVSKYVLRTLYRSLLRASTPFSPSTPHSSPSASAYASLIHRSGISHDWDECIHQLERRRKAKAALASSSSLSPSSLADANNKIKGGGRNIPRSWAQNLSRSYTDLQQEYQLRKEYFKQRYEADYDDSLDWEEEDDNDDDGDDEKEGEASSASTRMGRMEHLAVGTSSYYRHEQDIANNADEYYSSENDPKYVLFRHLLREWCVVSGNGSGSGSGHNNNDVDDDVNNTATTKQWPKKWSPNEEGYYEQGKIKQVALMKFPSQIQSTVDGNGLSVRDMIRREFRAPSVDERLRIEEEQISNSNTDLNGVLSSSDQSTARSSRTTAFPPSSYIDNEVRIQTAFYTLMELNRKLAWAEAIGFPPLFTSTPQKKQTSSLQQSMRDEMKWKRLVQAAKGVSLFATSPTAANGTNQIAIANDVSDGVVYDNSSTPSASSSSSSILQCGTYLVAHPLMTGYFAKSVIVILDHTEEEDEEEVNTKPTTSEEGDVEGKESSSGGGGGGTYGLIINRLALTPETMDSSNQRQYLEMMLRLRRQEVVEAEGGLKADTTLSSQCTTATTPTTTATKHPNILRSISLLQAINADDLPETVQSAFGDAPVREGGPVNLSLQMIHRKSFSEVAMKEETNNTEDINEEKDFGSASNSDIGGTILGYDHDRSKIDAQDAIYFGGDVIKASYSVLGGESDRDDFSFVIGAACWAPGQLQHEIERGCWLPFRGPASMALTGMCEHNEISIPTASSKTTNTDSEKASDGKGTTKLSMFPPRPSHPPTGALQEQTTGGQSMTRRPVGDLWLSVMCALGEGEAELANMLLDPNNVMHTLGDACDNFDR